MPDNWNEMTPKQRRLEKLLDYLLAALFAICLALILFYSI